MTAYRDRTGRAKESVGTISVTADFAGLRIFTPRCRAVVLSIALFSTLVSAASAGEKTDVLVMANGDRITGELKSLRQAQLSYKTDDLGTLTVDWDRVASLVSKKTVRLESEDGSLYYGVLETPTQEGNLAIRSDTGVEELALERVVSIAPIGKGFLKGLDGSFSLGASFTKSSDVLQISVSGDVNRRRRKSRTRLDLNAISTGQEDGTTQNINLALTYSRLLQNRWLAGGVGAYQRNQSLGIQNRILVGATGGRRLIETNRQELVVLGGLDTNFEQTTDVEDAGQTSLEALVSLQYARFHYHHPKQNFSFSLVLFPNLTESGRFRATFNTDWRQEIVNSLFFNLSLYSIYDSQPPEGALATTDYGIVTSIGYSFSP